MVPLVTAVSVNIGIIESKAQRDKYDSLCFIVVCSGTCALLFSASVIHIKSYPRKSMGYANPSQICGYAVVLWLVARATSFWTSCAGMQSMGQYTRCLGTDYTDILLLLFCQLSAPES